MEKSTILEELKLVTDFLADMPLINNPAKVISDTLSYAVYLINQLRGRSVICNFC